MRIDGLAHVLELLLALHILPYNLLDLVRDAANPQISLRLGSRSHRNVLVRLVVQPRQAVRRVLRVALVLCSCPGSTRFATLAIEVRHARICWSVDALGR